MGYVTGGGGSGSGGAPSGAASGELAGTYPGPTVADGVIDDANIVSGGLTNAALATAAAIANTKLATNPLARANHTGTQTMSTISDAGSLATKSAVASADITDGTIVSTDLSGSAGITSGQLAGSIAPSKITGTAVTAADTGTVTSAMILDATIAGGDLNASIAIPSGATGTTAAANTNSTTLSTTAYNVAQAKLYGGCYQVGPNTFASIPVMMTSTGSASPNAGDGRFARVMMAQSGTLHDVSMLIQTTGGNYNILVLDDGQANGTHTTRTCLYIKGSTSTPSAGVWVTGDASLAVNAGDTLVFMITFDGTTAKSYCGTGGTGSHTLPNSSFFPASGAATTNQKIAGTVLSANVPTTTSGAGSTLTDANCTGAAIVPLVVWRIS